MSIEAQCVIAVASGKGGTGKTTIAANLAAILSLSDSVCLADLDVEAPDSLGYFQHAVPIGQPENVEVLVPFATSPHCEDCSSCAKLCRFGAIVAIGGVVTIDTKLCKGCGLCIMACPQGNLEEKPLKIGEARTFTEGCITIVEGRMNVGDIRSTSVIESAKTKASVQKTRYQIRDCPPGVSCPATHALAGSDYAILVAEPTSFSLHDLDGAIRLCKSLSLPCGVIINKDGFGNADIETLCKNLNVPVLTRLSYGQDRAVQGARGALWAQDDETSKNLKAVLLNIKNKLQQKNDSKKTSSEKLEAIL
ncbi:ATP-binding protein [Spirochaetota bacterium]